MAAGGEWATAEEQERLAARLASLPTSEADDQALLDSGKVTGEEQGRASSAASQENLLWVDRGVRGSALKVAASFVEC